MECRSGFLFSKKVAFLWNFSKIKGKRRSQKIADIEKDVLSESLMHLALREHMKQNRRER